MNSIYLIIYSALLTISIIAGIGPQTMNIISHSISKNHAFSVTITAVIADVILILVGCIGIIAIESKALLNIIYLTGIIFLSYYCITKILTLFDNRRIRISNKIISKKQAIINSLALTLLNPLVFVDTIIVIGGNSSRYHGINHLSFTLGAVIGDALWLFGIMLISQRFAKQLNRPIIWKIIDLITVVLVGIVIFKMIGFFL